MRSSRARELAASVAVAPAPREPVPTKSRRNSRLETEPLSLYEAARLRADLQNGLLRMDAIGPREANPFQVAAPQDAINASSVRDVRPLTPGEQAMQPAGDRLTPYDRILRQMRENWMARVAGGEQGKAGAGEIDRQREMIAAYDELRARLGAGKQDSTGKGAIAPVKAKEAPLKDGAAKEGAPKDATEKDDRLNVGGVKISLEDYALILKHGTAIDAFGDDGKDRIDELLREGQRAMHQGNSFIAEKRFEVALLMKPGDARATAGLLHCQIGANLPGSASITLRALLTEHPEMMDVRYGAQAMPVRARIEHTLASTRERILNGRDASDFGLLEAYLGHLLGDENAIREGLSFVKGTPEDDTLRGLLERLWLAPGAKPGIEPPAAAPEPAAATTP